MTDFAQLLVVFLAVVNPAAVAFAWRDDSAPSSRRRSTLVGLGVGIALAAGAGLGAQRFLDFLDIEPETFRIAAGIVIAVIGLRAICWPMERSPREELAWGAYPLGWPLIANPACIAAAISFGVDSSPGRVALSAIPWAVVGAALALVTTRRFDGSLRAASQFTGVLAVAVGTALIVDGVRAI